MDAQCSKMKFVREEHYVGKHQGGGKTQWNNAIASFQHAKNAGAVCSMQPAGLGRADRSPWHEGMAVLGAGE